MTRTAASELSEFSAMANVKTNLAKLKTAEKIQFARQIVTDMTSNPNFPMPTPALPSVASAAATLEEAYNASQIARQISKSKTAAVVPADEALNLALTQLANYVQNASGGDAAKIQSAGFPVRNTPAPIGPLPAPTELEAQPSHSEGHVNLWWKGVRGASSYVVERAQDASLLNWVQALTTTKSRAVVNSMTSGARYWFRVAAVGAAGQGAWTDAISKIVP